MPLSIPTTLLFSLAPSFIGLVPAQKKIKVVSKLTLSEKCLQYYLFYQLASFDMNSSLFGLSLGILMYQWNEEFITFKPEQDVTGEFSFISKLNKRFRINGVVVMVIIVVFLLWAGLYI